MSFRLLLFGTVAEADRRTKHTHTMPARTIQKRRTPTVLTMEKEEWCYCRLCKYEVLCEPSDDDGSGPIRFVPRQDEVCVAVDAEWCYCRLCKYEVLCEPSDDDGSGPIRFVPQ